MSASDTATPTTSAKDVPLRDGPPTRAEMLAHYPAKFNWTQLRAFINSGDLGLLKRDKALQKRYDLWSVGIREQHGSMVNYLYNHRLQWGIQDNLSLLSSALDDDISSTLPNAPDAAAASISKERKVLPPIPDDAPPYFTVDTPPELISIIQNDWPYSVPPEVEHTLIWTRLPIFHVSLVHPSISARVNQDGLWGFTGSSSPPPSPSVLPAYLGALEEWGVTMDKMIRSERATFEEAQLVQKAGQEVDAFVRKRWDESKWETAWFVNPPRLQSVPGLAHIHVFARPKL
ncbi:hypothetical protein PLICRDRAFT_39694 [Plicaturopsis crispa FD-325 SS-3]|nr:hypothetical protein PLICRDRAFT_39694 [Plicaturopsis crispa FD-325 SS-3]